MEQQNVGWECQKCRRCYSPSTSICMYCPQQLQAFSTSNTTTISHKFEADNSSTATTSATKCKICGLEKWQHSLFTNTI